MRFGFLFLGALALAACDDVTVAEPDAIWMGSIGSLVASGNDPNALEFVYQDGAGPEHGLMAQISDEDPTLSGAVRLETFSQPPQIDSLQARLVTSGGIASGATCWLRFDARAAQPQTDLALGRLSISVRAKTPDLEPLLDRLIYLAPIWTEVDLAFKAPTAFAPGDIAIVFGVGTRQQTVDIASASMRCFGDSRPVARFPSTSFSYAGRDQDAPWRTAAERQIERHRKGDLFVNVTDGSGQPVADAEVHIQMSQHDFTFGAIVDAGLLAGADADDDGDGKTASYRRNLKELFNAATFLDGFHWIAWSNPEIREESEAALAWIRSLGLDLWALGPVAPTSLALPPNLEDEIGVPDVVRNAIRTGIEATASELEEHVNAWYVVDKPRDNQNSLDLLGLQELAGWFQLIQSVAPDAELALSESEILAGDRMAEYGTLLGNLISEGAPISRVGVEGRFGAQPPPIQVLIDRLDQLAGFDLPLVVTGFDMVTDDEQLRQDFMRDFLTLAFSHPSVEGFFFRHYWEDDSERDATAIYRQDGTVSSIGNIYRNLVLDRWWTDVVERSDAEGALTSRVFLGDYTISARKDGQTGSATLSLGPDGAAVTIELSSQNEGG